MVGGTRRSCMRRVRCRCSLRRLRVEWKRSAATPTLAGAGSSSGCQVETLWCTISGQVALATKIVRIIGILRFVSIRIVLTLGTGSADDLDVELEFIIFLFLYSSIPQK